MTDNVVADHIYLKPLTPESIIEILEERQIDAVLPTMGGQTALNLCIKQTEKVFGRNMVLILLVLILMRFILLKIENRFRKLMNEIDIPVAPARIATSFLQGKKIAQELGFLL